MEFCFFNYIFPNDLETLKQYLLENQITYKIIDNKMFFQFENECCNKPIVVSVAFDNGKIIRIQLKCYPISFNNKKRIIEELNSKYKYIERDANTLNRIYETDEYRIVVNDPGNILIDVQFESVQQLDKKEEKLQIKRIIMFTIIGVLLSTLFITLYFINKSNLLINIITAVLSIAYAMFQFIYLYLRKTLMDRSEKIILCILIPLIYIVVLSILAIFLFAKIGVSFDPETKINIIDILFIFIYLAPSFHVLALIASGLAYA